jgi:uncharacterized protein YbaR (Trm112 family)
MDVINTNCPRCSKPLEVPLDFDTLICASCGTTYQVRQHKGAVNLLETGPTRESEADEVIDARLAELDELIEQANSEIESLRSREQSEPLQLGCAVFGLLMTVIVVISVFMLLGKHYVGHWLFYASLAAVILLGLARIRRKLSSRTQIHELREERLKLEDGLAQLEAERNRVERLKARLHAQQP